MRIVQLSALALAVQLALLTGCGGGSGGGGNSTTTAAPAPAPAPAAQTLPEEGVFTVVSTPSNPGSNLILAEEASTAKTSEDAPMEVSEPVATTVATPPAKLSATTAAGTGDLSTTVLSRPLHLSEFQIDLSRFSNPSKAYVSIFVASTDWVGERTGESRQFLLSSLGATATLDSNNLLRFNLPRAVTHISVTIFDRQQTITSRIPL